MYALWFASLAAVSPPIECGISVALDLQLHRAEVIVVGVVDGDHVVVEEALKGTVPSTIRVRRLPEAGAGDRFLLVLQRDGAGFSLGSCDAYPIRDGVFVGDPHDPCEELRASSTLALEAIRAGLRRTASPLLLSQLAGLEQRLRGLDVDDAVDVENAVWLLDAAYVVDVGAVDEAALVVGVGSRAPRIARLSAFLLARKKTATARQVLVERVRAAGPAAVRGAAARAAVAAGVAAKDLGPALRVAVDDKDADVARLVRAAIDVGAVDDIAEFVVGKGRDLAVGFDGDDDVVDALLLLHSDAARSAVIEGADASGARRARKRNADVRYLLFDGAPRSIEAVVRIVDRSMNGKDVVDILTPLAVVAPAHPAWPRLLRQELAKKKRPPINAIFLVDDHVAAELLSNYMLDVSTDLSDRMSRVREVSDRERVDAVLASLDTPIGMHLVTALLVTLVREVAVGDEARVVAALRARSSIWNDADVAVAALQALGATVTADERSLTSGKPLTFPLSRPKNAP